MRARWSTFCLSLCCGAAALANDVPAPPETTVSPQAIFSDDAYVPPTPDSSGTVAPDAVYSSPAPAAAPTQRYYYAPAKSGRDEFMFAGYNAGLTSAIGGDLDELFNAGVQVVVETGWQTNLADDGLFRSLALVVGFSNQTIWARDQHGIALADGTYRGLSTLSIDTLKLGTYVGSKVGGIDFFTGVYSKVGVAVLNEDVEFFTPGTIYTPATAYHNNAFTGGFGAEVGVALLERDTSSLAFVVGAEALYLNTFDTANSSWNMFLTSGFQWEFDITDGLFPQRNRSPRERGGRRARRGR